ncbi:hypothetical protein ETH01_16220 [Enterococcus thailandicus]|uniref:Uncharacterized protein n=1 Tax=Enterococcus thailandicus TaxID=417368 RepID=A0A510WI60_ENTTH|nr:hypothetical protein ETH01_16220 [Enterococcus thailandicus]
MLGIIKNPPPKMKSVRDSIVISQNSIAISRNKVSGKEKFEYKKAPKIKGNTAGKKIRIIGVGMSIDTRNPI